MNPTNIGWCTHTWNPITGCKRGCNYCYAKSLHEKRRIAALSGKDLPFYYKEPFEKIQIHEERFNDKDLNRKKPMIVFVGSMSDIEYWPRGKLQEIANICGKHLQHTFMFLSKSPNSYYGIVWHNNCMQGLTLEKVSSLQDNYSITLLVGKCPRPYLSIEPIFGSVHYNQSFTVMEKIIVGCDSSKSANQPKPEYIQSVKDHVPEDKIFWKENIKKYL